MAIKICLFCGSRFGNENLWKIMANELGKKIGKNKFDVVYGGGEWGLMGAVAKAAEFSGSKVLGIITNELLEFDKNNQSFGELIIVNSINERKKQMINISDIFLVLPGGIGTLDELFEVWTTKQLGEHKKPIILLNYKNFFDNLIEFIDKNISNGFLLEDHKKHLTVCSSVDEVLRKVSEYSYKKLKKTL